MLRLGPMVRPKFLYPSGIPRNRIYWRVELPESLDGPQASPFKRKAKAEAFLQACERELEAKPGG